MLKKSEVFSKDFHKFIPIAWVYGLLIIVSTSASLLAIKNIKISPDSMIYALISQEILSGNGIRLPINISMENDYMFVNGTVPYLAQPPLLPILFAILGGVTPQNFLPAQMINLISHVAVSICTFLLMKRLSNNLKIALVTGVITSLSFPLLWNVNHMLSESLFITLITATLYFLLSSRYSDKFRSAKYAFAAGVCAAAAISTRFPGVALIPVFLWQILITDRRRERTKFKYVVLSTSLPVITTMVFFIRNYVISGTIAGWNAPSPDRPYLDAFTGTIRMISQQFPLGSRSISLIVISMGLFTLYNIINPNVRREFLKHIRSGLDLFIVFIISYTTLISYSMARVQEVFELRYVSPLVPSLFLVGISIITFFWGMIRREGFRKLSSYGLILSLGIVTLGNCYKTYLRLDGFFHKQTTHYSILNLSTYNWIKDHYREDIIITTNRPYHLSFFGGYPTVALPHKRFESKTHIPENMESFLPEKMSQFGSTVLALFERAEVRYEGEYITRLFNHRKGDKNFNIVYECSDGVVYELKDGEG